MRRIQISERARSNVTHIEAPGCIVNITHGLSEARTGRGVTSIEVIPNSDCDLPDATGQRVVNVRVRFPEAPGNR